MSATLRDRVAGTFLFAVALIWIGLVYWTIPPSVGATAGPRAFPLFFGFALALLSLLLLTRTFITAPAKPEEAPVTRDEVGTVVATIGATVVYGAFLEQLGFLLATPIFLAVVMLLLLRERRPVHVAAMSLGLALGSYVLFGKLLGTYLPPGTWFPIYF